VAVRRSSTFVWKMQRGTYRLRAAQAAAAMKVTRVEAVYRNSRDDAPWWPHWVWLRVCTVSGAGAPRPGSGALAAHVAGGYAGTAKLCRFWIPALDGGPPRRRSIWCTKRDRNPVDANSTA
jgi:hypothetical protein